ncbi:hypothetical protein TNCV_3627821 [Trichonephila clavipes]|nr:hypothetical protein TNCV_3627821 [Trichonephila clavipes]
MFLSLQAPIMIPHHKHIRRFKKYGKTYYPTPGNNLTHGSQYIIAGITGGITKWTFLNDKSTKLKRIESGLDY